MSMGSSETESNQPVVQRKKNIRKWIILLIIIAVLMGFLSLAGEYLKIDSELNHADLIVVLSGNDAVRLKAAAELYKEGYSETILLTNTGRTYGEYNIPYTQLQIEMLKELDVPEGAIHQVDFVAKNTGQEGTAIIEGMVNLRANSVIIVTDAWHTRRVKTIFDDTFSNTNYSVQYYGVSESKINPKLWWLSADGWKNVIGEYIRIIGYYIKRDTNIPDYPIFNIS